MGQARRVVLGSCGCSPRCFMFVLLGIGCGMTFSIAYGIWVSDWPLAVKISVYALMLAAIIRSSIKAWSAFIVVERNNRTDSPMTLAQAAGDSTSPSDRRSRSTSAAFRGTDRMDGRWRCGWPAGDQCDRQPWVVFRDLRVSLPEVLRVGVPGSGSSSAMV